MCYNILYINISKRHTSVSGKCGDASIGYNSTNKKSMQQRILGYTTKETKCANVDSHQRAC